MKYYKVDMYTLFEDTNNTVVFAFEDDAADEDVDSEIMVEFEKYMCALSALLGSPASYTEYEQYEQLLDEYVRNSGFSCERITEDEFLVLQNSTDIKS